jgi:hypothetical protein
VVYPKPSSTGTSDAETIVHIQKKSESSAPVVGSEPSDYCAANFRTTIANTTETPINASLM